MQRVAQHDRSAKEDADVGLGMLLRQTAKDPVPVRSPEMRRRPQARDRVAFGADVGNDDVVHVFLFDLRGQVDGDFDPVLRVLFLDRVQERMEPFRRPKVADDPDEVDFGEPSGFGRGKVVQAVPDRLED